MEASFGKSNFLIAHADVSNLSDLELLLVFQGCAIDQPRLDETMMFQIACD